VGDRYVLERMLETGAILGGEQSGHIVHLGGHTTGDGLATALLLLGALARLEITMDDAAELVRPFPQRLVNVPADRSRLADADRVWEGVERAAAELGHDGRVVVRASGTEPVVRVMVEAADEETCIRTCDRLSRLVAEQIGE
jgi:phosphoglucosamine mutase